MAKHNQLGKDGENAACNYLAEKGYTILERNYRYQRNEVDIISSFNNELIIIEVKSRSSNYFGNPEAFVTDQQIKTIVKVVDAYIQLKDIDMEVRFDIITITKTGRNFQINHIENAFNCF